MSFHHANTAFDEAPFNAEEQAERARSTGWGEPDLTLLGTNRRPAPAFPVALLGPFWSDWATRAAAAASSPVDYTACALLAATGATLANVRWPVAGAGWAEPPVLWMGEVGTPSSGKSPALDMVARLVRNAEDTMAAGFDDDLRRHETDKAAAEAVLKVWKGEMEAYAKNPEGSPPAKPTAADIPDAPVRPRIRVADATIEKLAVLSAGLPRGLLLARDELSGWVANFDRYGGNGSDRSFFLEAYGGRGYKVDRMKNADPITVRHLSIGILGTTQPDRLDAFTGGADDGLACRFLWSWPDVPPGFTLAREPFDDMPANYAFNRLPSIPMGSDQFGHAEPVYLRLDPDAENLIEDFGHEMAGRAEQASGPYAGAIGKARGHVLRLSLVLEYLRWSGESGAVEPSSVSLDAVRHACGLVGGYFLPMAERVYGDAAIPTEERNAMVIARRLRRDQLRQFNARDLGRTLSTELRSGEKMTAACNVLLDCGLIRRQDREAGQMGRTAKNFDVHPAVYGRS